jgi:hypothetical protein
VRSIPSVGDTHTNAPPRPRAAPPPPAAPAPLTARSLSPVLRRVIEPTAFRKFYERGDLPIAIHHAGLGNKLKWKVRCHSSAPAAARHAP